MSVIKGPSVSYSPSVVANTSVSPFTSVPWPDAALTPPFNPLDIPNLNYWLNLANPATVIRDGLGNIVSIESDGDVSGTVSQGDISQTYVYMPMGSPPYAIMAGSQPARMTLNDGGNSNHWWCFVFSAGIPDVGQLAAPLIVGTDDPTIGFLGTLNNVPFYVGASVLLTADGGVTQRLVENVTVTDQARHILEMRPDGFGGVGDVYLDGQLLPLAIAVNDFTSYASLGCNAAVFNNGSDGSQLCEMLQCSGNIPDNLRSGLYTYLSQKWGVVL